MSSDTSYVKRQVVYWGQVAAAAAGGQVDDVKPLQGRLAGAAVVLAEGERHVSRLVRAGLLPWGRKDGSVGLDRVEVVPQDRPGHVEALLGETMHAL